MDQNRKRVCFCHDIGTGKTLIALYTIKLWRARRTLIVCPNSTIRKTWEPQVKKYTDFSYIILKGTTEERAYKLQANRQLYIINYEGLMHLYGQRVEDGFVIDKKSFVDEFDCLIFDEIHHLKNWAALQTKIARELSKKAEYVIGMTGTPIAKDELDLWSEYLIIDGGVSLGTNFFAFRGTYFNSYSITLKNSGRDILLWSIRKGAKDQILNRVANCTLRFSREECLDLPELQYETYSAQPTKKQIEILNKIGEGTAIELENGQLSKQNVFVRSMRMQQVTGGFLPNDQGEPTSIDTPKLDLLEECLEEIEGKVVVFHTFIEEGRRIESLLEKNKIKFRSLRGEIKDKDKQYIEFREDPTVKVLVAHPKCGGEGIDLYEAATMIFYSSPSGPITRNQAEGRIYRQGQTKKCLIIDLVLEDTVDEIVAKKAETNQQRLSMILNFFKTFKHRGI